MIIPAPLQTAIDELSKLPSVGRKTAQRLAMHLLKADKSRTDSLVEALKGLKEKIRFCSKCFNISEDEMCDICRSHKRDHSLICVVSDSGDIISIERSNEYNGLYHVLGGVLSPLSGKTASDLRIKELVIRLEDKSEPVREVILALNPDAEGEATSLYLARLIKERNIKVTRLARGLPIGGNIEFADEATLGRAVSGRLDY